MTLVRFDPFRDVERLAEQAWRPRRPALPFDAYRRAHELVLHFDLPGVDPSSIDLTVEKHSLIVSAERHSPKQEGDEVLANERASGRFTRELTLGDGLDTEHVDAQYNGGVLTVTIPVASEVRPRRVPVQTGSPSVTTSAEATSVATAGEEATG